MKRAATIALYAITLLMGLSCAVVLSACGGGGDPEPTTGTDPVDCKAHPEQCK